METVKSPLQSLTVISAAAAAMLNLVSVFGVRIDPALAGQAVDGATQLGSAVMAGIAIYGRLRATKRIARGT